MRPIAIDLFCGAGGLSLGLEQAGFDVVAAVDIDPIHCATHLYNFPQCKIICNDIKKLDGKIIRKKSSLDKSTDIDLIAGGSPCQGYSLIGKREKNDPRNKLIYEFVRIVSELKPKYFLFENVSGITIGNQSSHLTKLINLFKSIGYNIVEPYKVLNAAEYGVPQNRKRLFLIGARKGLNLPDYPAPITRPREQRLNGYDQNLPLCPSVKDAIKDLPNVSRHKSLLKRDSIYVNLNGYSEYSALLRGVKKDVKDYSHERDWDDKLLTSSTITLHSDETRMRFRKTPPGQIECISRFHKLSLNGMCNTIRAGTDSDRGNHTAPRPIHPTQARCITVREAARLHSYPDWFRFHVTKWHGFRQVGNSVPPRLARIVASKIIRSLEIKIIKSKNKIKLGDESLLSMNKTDAMIILLKSQK